MGKLQDSLEKQIDELPRRALQRVIREKLIGEGVEDEELIARIVVAFEQGKETFPDIGFDRPVRLEFTDADVERIRASVASVGDRMPAIIDKLVENAVDGMIASLTVQWRGSPHSHDEAAETRARIVRDWAEGFDALRFLLALCRDEGDNFNISQLRSDLISDGQRDVALARLHIRACRVAEEILLLLEYGHTEGAQARWRTLHEVVVTAALIAEGGDLVAERYFAHEVVERKKALDDHRRALLAAGDDTSRIPGAAALERDHEAAVARYGRQFRGMYGWASGQLGLPADPKFHDLQEVAGSLALKLRYRLSSFDTHASPKALAQPVHNWDPTTHIPDTFALGLEGPAIDTAQALVHITALLFPQPLDLDACVLIATLSRLRDKASDVWASTARAIDRRERRAMERAVRRPGRRIGYVKAKPGKRRV